MKPIFTSLILLFCLHSLSAQEFRHPGILHSEEALQRITRLVEMQTYPAIGSYQKLRADRKSSFRYAMQGPFRDISRSGKYAYTKTPCEEDFNAAYYNALMWQITHDTRHADKAMEILRAYAATLAKVHPIDAPLCAGLQGFILINAAEIMRYTYTADVYSNGWCTSDTEQTERMVREVFMPVMEEFYATKPYTNGNWGIAVTKAQMGFAVFLNDAKSYRRAIDFFYHGKDNGSLPNYIHESGQLQESGRDQAHCMLAIGCLSEIAEIAWNQGEDLYAALDNRIMKGCEYLAKSNLGYEVPFFTWTDLTGKYSSWHQFGEAAKGEWRAVFELPYNHYVERRGLAMPYTREVLGRIRPEGIGWTCDNPGFGTLLFYLGEGEAQPAMGQIDERPQERLHGWKFASAGICLVDGQMRLNSSGVALSKKGIRYDADKYPYIEVTIPHMPKRHNRRWLQLIVNIMSAPEYWIFDERDAEKVDAHTYRFRIAGSRSTNGTLFPLRMTSVTLQLDFGETNGEGVALKQIRSVANK